MKSSEYATNCVADGLGWTAGENRLIWDRPSSAQVKTATAKRNVRATRTKGLSVNCKERDSRFASRRETLGQFTSVKTNAVPRFGARRGWPSNARRKPLTRQRLWAVQPRRVAHSSNYFSALAAEELCKRRLSHRQVKTYVRQSGTNTSKQKVGA